MGVLCLMYYIRVIQRVCFLHKRKLYVCSSAAAVKQAKADFIESPNANAIGYEILVRSQLKR